MSQLRRSLIGFKLCQPRSFNRRTSSAEVLSKSCACLMGVSTRGKTMMVVMGNSSVEDVLKIDPEPNSVPLDSNKCIHRCQQR
jgi:hypothetical protein